MMTFADPSVLRLGLCRAYFPSLGTSHFFPRTSQRLRFLPVLGSTSVFSRCKNCRRCRRFRSAWRIFSCLGNLFSVVYGTCFHARFPAQFLPPMAHVNPGLVRFFSRSNHISRPRHMFSRLWPMCSRALCTLCALFVALET